MTQEHAVVTCDLAVRHVQVPVAMVLRWERHMRWDTSAVTARAIRDYLTHDLPTQPDRGGAHD